MKLRHRDTAAEEEEEVMWLRRQDITTTAAAAAEGTLSPRPDMAAVPSPQAMGRLAAWQVGSPTSLV